MRRPPQSPRHLETRVVLDYLDDRLDAADRRRVEDHLAGPCARCRDLLHELSRLIETMRTDRIEEVPEALTARALEAFEAQPAPARILSGTWRNATLVFDSLREPLPAMLRRTLGDARWLRFMLGGHELELEADPETGDGWTLRGRFDAPDAALYRIEIEAAGEQPHTWLDAEGRFAIEGVPGGAIRIAVLGPEEHYRLPDLVL